MPQGSVLGPLLFLIYINDITENLSSTPTLFADDTSLSKQIVDDRMTLDLQNDLNTIGNWAKRWKIKFNPLKSVSLLISRTTEVNDSTTYRFQNHDVKKVSDHTHLGLTWSSNGTWKKNI